ncbi:hypothetical protein AURDEDRAFT_130932 [Auricularia subglabra TFB-10046 SS5]|uniref:Uncharacterized protein n=1 Tax=Auricularia subglabra (strain TFB-10046 / SS5) TaxID=717982 RepID=J0CWD6_AURST|nr:hypothetical protein AURDEDRAFT_130932 [Auricularia subglabra TFB-10046 SS5]
MSHASGSGSGAGCHHSGPGPGHAVKREPRPVGKCRCRGHNCSCTHFWALVDIDADGKSTSSTPRRRPPLFLVPSPTTPRLEVARSLGASADSLISLHLASATLDSAVLTTAPSRNDVQPLRGFQCFGESMDEPDGSTNSRRVKSILNHRIKGPLGVPAAGVVGARPGPRTLPTGRVAQQRGRKRAAEATSASHPYVQRQPAAAQPKAAKRAPGRPPLPKVISGRLVIFPIDVSDEENNWCPSAPHPSNIDLDIYTSLFNVAHDTIPSLSNRLGLFDLTHDFTVSGPLAERGTLYGAIQDIALQHLASCGFKIHSTDGPINGDMPQLRLLTTASQSRRVVFRPLARSPADVTVSDLKKHRMLGSEDLYYIFLCPRGLRSYIIAQITRLPSLRTDATCIVPDIMHHCFSVRVFDAVSDLDARDLPVIPGRCSTICVAMLSNHALSSLGGWQSTTPAFGSQPATSAINVNGWLAATPAPGAAAAPDYSQASDSLFDDQDMEDAMSFIAGPSGDSSQFGVASASTRALSPPLSFLNSAESSSGSAIVRAPTPARTLTGWPPYVIQIDPAPAASSSSTTAPSSSARSRPAPRRHTASSIDIAAALRAIGSTGIAAPPAPPPVPAASIPFGGAALLAQLATQPDGSAASLGFDMTVQPANGASSAPAPAPGDDSSDSSDSSSEGGDDHHGPDNGSDSDQDLPTDGPQFLYNLSYLSGQPPDHRLWLPHREALLQRLRETVPTVAEGIKFAYYAGSLIDRTLPRPAVGEIIAYVFECFAEREPARRPERICCMVKEKYPDADIDLSGFSLRGLLSPSGVFEVGAAVGDGVRDSIAAAGIEFLTSTLYWRDVGRYKVPFLVQFGDIDAAGVKNLKAVGKLILWCVVQAGVIPFLHPMLVFIFAVSRYLNRSLRDQSILSLLVDLPWIRAIDSAAWAALRLWPTTHDKPIPPLTNPSDAPLATLHEWYWSVTDLPLTTPRTRSLHASLTLAIFTRGLVGLDLVSHEVPRGWLELRDSIDDDVSLSDYPILATPLTRLFFKPFGQGDNTEQEEIRDLKLLLIGLASLQPTAHGVKSRIKYEPFVPAAGDEELQNKFSRLFNRYIERPGHPQPIMDALGIDYGYPPPPPDIIKALRPTLFVRTLTGFDALPVVSYNASQSAALAFTFHFVYVPDPAAHISNPALPPMSFHVCTHTVDVRINTPFREMLERSVESLDHAILQTVGHTFLDTEFDIHPTSPVLQSLLEADGDSTLLDPMLLIIASSHNTPSTRPEFVSADVLAQQAARFPSLGPTLQVIHDDFIACNIRMALVQTEAVVQGQDTILIIESQETLDALLSVPQLLRTRETSVAKHSIQKLSAGRQRTLILHRPILGQDVTESSGDECCDDAGSQAILHAEDPRPVFQTRAAWGDRQDDLLYGVCIRASEIRDLSHCSFEPRQGRKASATFVTQSRIVSLQSIPLYGLSLLLLGSSIAVGSGDEAIGRQRVPDRQYGEILIPWPMHACLLASSEIRNMTDCDAMPKRLQHDSECRFGLASLAADRASVYPSQVALHKVLARSMRPQPVVAQSNELGRNHVSGRAHLFHVNGDAFDRNSSQWMAADALVSGCVRGVSTDTAWPRECREVLVDWGTAEERDSAVDCVTEESVDDGEDEAVKTRPAEERERALDGVTEDSVDEGEDEVVETRPAEEPEGSLDGVTEESVDEGGFEESVDDGMDKAVESRAVEERDGTLDRVTEEGVDEGVDEGAEGRAPEERDGTLDRVADESVDETVENSTLEECDCTLDCATDESVDDVVESSRVEECDCGMLGATGERVAELLECAALEERGVTSEDEDANDPWGTADSATDGCVELGSVPVEVGVVSGTPRAFERFPLAKLGRLVNAGGVTGIPVSSLGKPEALVDGFDERIVASPAAGLSDESCCLLALGAPDRRNRTVPAAGVSLAGTSSGKCPGRYRVGEAGRLPAVRERVTVGGSGSSSAPEFPEADRKLRVPLSHPELPGAAG